MNYSWLFTLSVAAIGTACTSQNSTNHCEKKVAVSVTSSYAPERLDSILPGIPTYQHTVLHYQPDTGAGLKVRFEAASIVTH